MITVMASAGSQSTITDRSHTVQYNARLMKRIGVPGLLFIVACQTTKPAPEMKIETRQQLIIAAATPQRLTQLARSVIDYDRFLLTDNERQVVTKLIEASKLIDEIFWRQVS